jgi:hypothetical protein
VVPRSVNTVSSKRASSSPPALPLHARQSLYTSVGAEWPPYFGNDSRVHQMSLEITFTGLEARRDRIEANDGLESLAGFAHAATLVAHFVATGNVRLRQPYDDGLRFYFEDARPGSLTAILGLGGALAVGAAGNLVYDVIKGVWKRATGTGDEGNLTVGGEEFLSGDIDALTEAVSPSLLRGHTWISHPEQRISIKTGRQILVDFNEGSKRYLKEEIVEEGESVQDVSVAALNVNSRYGRVFFHDLGRTVPFKVDKTAPFRAIPALSRYLTKYAEKTNLAVSIKFKKVLYLDGRLKRVIILDAYGAEDLA